MHNPRHRLRHTQVPLGNHGNRLKGPLRENTRKLWALTPRGPRRENAGQAHSTASRVREAFQPGRGNQARGGSRKAPEGEWGQLRPRTTTMVGAPRPRDE